VKLVWTASACAGKYDVVVRTGSPVARGPGGTTGSAWNEFKVK